VFGLTMPLVTKSDGTKFGKTESGTIWLDARKTSPYAFYQFWLGTADADVYKFLRYFSFLSVAEIAAIEEADKARDGKPEAQRILAEQVTELVHGKAALAAAQRITHSLFSNDLSSLTEDDFAQLAQDGLPHFVLNSADDSLIDAVAAWPSPRAKRAPSSRAVPSASMATRQTASSIALLPMTVCLAASACSSAARRTTR
jgi:tyrosyl-tRNA synthetase